VFNQLIRPLCLISMGISNLVHVVQLQAKFEALKKQHSDDKKKLEDKKRLLEDQMNNFEQRKAHTLTSSQAGLGGAGKKKK